MNQQVAVPAYFANATIAKCRDCDYCQVHKQGELPFIWLDEFKRDVKNHIRSSAHVLYILKTDSEGNVSEVVMQIGDETFPLPVPIPQAEEPPAQ